MLVNTELYSGYFAPRMSDSATSSDISLHLRVLEQRKVYTVMVKIDIIIVTTVIIISLMSP